MQIRIRTGFNADPDPAFYPSADPDPAFYPSADPDPAFYLNADSDPRTKLMRIHPDLEPGQTL
jgi:hypothetical protein